MPSNNFSENSSSQHVSKCDPCAQVNVLLSLWCTEIHWKLAQPTYFLNSRLLDYLLNEHILFKTNLLSTVPWLMVVSTWRLVISIISAVYPRNILATTATVMHCNMISRAVQKALIRMMSSQISAGSGSNCSSEQPVLYLNFAHVYKHSIQE